MSKPNSLLLQQSLKLLLFSLLGLASQPLIAGEAVTVNSGKYQTAVVELYTSEGCSSCPPAERWLDQLLRVPKSELDVFALAFHVDYWDYIGWKDRFANPSYTRRQRHLANINKQSSIYTPEFFVDGLEARGTRHIIDNIKNTNKALSPIDLKLTLLQANNTIQIQLSSGYQQIQNPQVSFILYENDLVSEVNDGENAGQTLRHPRVVRYLSPKQALQPELSHSIPINPEWTQLNLGIGVLIKSKTGSYLQSVFSPFAQAAILD